jgi:hypothetical protein
MMILVDNKFDIQYANGGVRNMEMIPNSVYTNKLRKEAVWMIAEGA